MVTAKRDLESEDAHLIFDLSMFDFGTTKKANKMDKHLKLMEAQCAKRILDRISNHFTRPTQVERV